MTNQREPTRLETELNRAFGLPDWFTRGDDNGEDMAQLKDWGFFHMNIPDAAKLTVVDMWFSGAFPEVEEPDDFKGDGNDPRILGGLKSEIDKFHSRLLGAVVSGSLKADLIKRDMDDAIIPERTYIGFYELIDWLDERGHIGREEMSLWIENQEKRADAALWFADFFRCAEREEIKKLTEFRFNAQVAAENNWNLADFPDHFQRDLSNTPLEIGYMAAVEEVHHLRRALSSHPKPASDSNVDRPLSSRQRRTLLTIIAAICDYSDIKPNAREAAGQIASMTDEIGASVTAETIRELLKEIPNALETRKK